MSHGHRIIHKQYKATAAQTLGLDLGLSLQNGRHEDYAAVSVKLFLPPAFTKFLWAKTVIVSWQNLDILDFTFV